MISDSQQREGGRISITNQPQAPYKVYAYTLIRINETGLHWAPEMSIHFRKTSEPNSHLSTSGVRDPQIIQSWTWIGFPHSNFYLGLGNGLASIPQKNHGSWWIADDKEESDRRAVVCGELHTVYFSFLLHHSLFPMKQNLCKYLYEIDG